MTTASLIALLQGTAAIDAVLNRAVNVPDPKPAAVYDSVLPRGGNRAFPAIVVHRYNMGRDQDMSGPIDLREDFFQLDIYGDTGAALQGVLETVEPFLSGYTSETVQGTYLERAQDLPYLPNASSDAQAFRSLFGYRFVSKV